MRHNKWGGLVTNASPYAVPPGAAVEQVNLCTDVPGQLHTRGGMLPVRFVRLAPAILDAYPYEINGQSTLVVLASDGSLVALDSPSYGESPVPVEPAIVVTSSAIGTSYTLRHIDMAAGGVSDPVPPAPPAPPPPFNPQVPEPPPEPPLPPPVPVPGISDVYVTVLSGSPTPAFVVDCNNLCAGATKEDEFDGGFASTSDIPLSLKQSELCAL